MKLEDFELYKRTRELSREAWGVYHQLSWQDKKIIGDQFMRSVDSVGANIAEAWGRYHFLDKNKFNYNARGSLTESIHWINLLAERSFIPSKQCDTLQSKASEIYFMLNAVISATKIKSKETT